MLLCTLCFQFQPLSRPCLLLVEHFEVQSLLVFSCVVLDGYIGGWAASSSVARHFWGVCLKGCARLEMINSGMSDASNLQSTISSKGVLH